MHPTALPLLPHEIDQLPLRDRIHATLEAAEEAVFRAMDEDAAKLEARLDTVVRHLNALYPVLMKLAEDQGGEARAELLARLNDALAVAAED